MELAAGASTGFPTNSLQLARSGTIPMRYTYRCLLYALTSSCRCAFRKLNAVKYRPDKWRTSQLYSKILYSMGWQTYIYAMVVAHMVSK
jgi:hypothetical protein